MTYRDPLGVEIKVGQKVVYLGGSGIGVSLLKLGTVVGISDVGEVLVESKRGRRFLKDLLEIYVVGLDK